MIPVSRWFRGRLAPAPLGALALALAALAPATRADDSEAGRPLVATFSPRELERAGAGEVGPQFFDFASAPNGLLYVANNLGLLEFDGIRWRKIEIPPGRIALSVAVDAQGAIWVGGTAVFGRLEPDARGVSVFRSWVDRLDPTERDFSDVWSTMVTADGVFLRSPERLFRVVGQRVESFRPAGRFGTSEAVHGRLLVRDTGRGLLRFENGALVQVAGGERFATERLYAYLPFDATRALLGARGGELYLYDPAAAASLVPFAYRAQEAVGRHEIYHGVALADGTFALATLRGGVFVIDRDGRLVRRFDRQAGLREDSVLRLFADPGGGLWVGHNRGLSRVAYPSALTRFVEDDGLSGSIEALARFRGVLHAGGTQSLYALERDAGGRPAFREVEPLAGQTFDLKVVDDALFVAGDEGVTRWDGRRAERLLDASTHRIVPSSADPNVLWIGARNGVAALVRSADGWQVSRPSAAVPFEVSALLEHPPGTLWIGTEYAAELLHRARVVAARDADGAVALADVERYGPASGLPAGYALPFRFGGELVVGTVAGPRRRLSNAPRFEPHAELARALPSPKELFRIVETAPGRAWAVADNRLVRVGAAPDGFRQLAEPTPSLPYAGRILSLLEEPDGVLWIGSDQGLFRFDPSRREPARRAAAVTLRSIFAGDGRLLWGGAGGDAGAFAARERSLRFEYASRGASERALFRSRLDGLEADWSAPTLESRRDFTNLPPGDYRFLVALDDPPAPPTQAAVGFQILPFWHETVWARAALLALAGLAVLGAVRWRLAHLARRTRELELVVEQKTEALREASFTDPLTGARNRRHFAQVAEPGIARLARDGAAAEELLLLLVDLDRFKSVNDRFGHPAGDAVLVESAQRIRTVMRPDDLLVRWGGEEFLLVARRRPRERGDELARGLLDAFRGAPMALPDGGRVTQTCSIGWAPFPLFPAVPAAVGVDDLLRLADRALYVAKEEGRDASVGIVPRPGALAEAPFEERFELLRSPRA